MVNPVDNPMNRTINTTQPPQTGVIGVDIDRLDISAALTPGDTAVHMTYTTGGDKYWVVYNLVDIWMEAGSAVDVRLDAVIGPGAAGTVIVNLALWDTGTTGDQGTLVANALWVSQGSVSDAGPSDASLADGSTDADASPLEDASTDAWLWAEGGLHSDGGDQPPTSPVGCACQGKGAGPLTMTAFLVLLACWLCFRRRRIRA